MIKTLINRLLTPNDIRHGRVVRVRLDQSNFIAKPGHVVLTKQGPGIVESINEGLNGDRLAVKVGNSVRYLKPDSVYIYHVYDVDLEVLFYLNPNDYYYIAESRQKVDFTITHNGYAALTTEYRVDHDDYNRIQRMTNGGLILRKLISYKLIK